MKDYYILLTIGSLHIAQCLIPSLVVKMLDKTLIARKRQDTMDMCRLFTEENQKTHHNHAPKIIKSYIPNKSYVPNIKKDTRFKREIHEETPKESQLRFKRDLNQKNAKENKRYKRFVTKYAVNPALSPVDARRVENIVDKLYDDLEEKGKRVTYRQAQTTNSIKVNWNQTFQPSRRFDFAPKILMGPQDELKKAPIQPDDGPFDSKARWKYGIVPYFIDFRTYDTHLSELIVKAFDYVERATCIRLQKLREKPTDKLSMESIPWVYITNPTGIRQCVHSNENRRVDGVLMTVFGYDCMSLGDIIHEVMHILGYSHEHLRSDRDQHITILWENVKPGYKKFFDLNRVGSEYDLETLPYDYSSILHYPPRAFSKNGQVTIMTESGVRIGQREGLSEIDVEKVAVIYSNECISRNREYLLQTCPSVVKSVTKPTNIPNQDIEDYFKERLWPFGIINYKLRDKMEFTVEERENIKTVIRHIEQESCLQFRDVGPSDDDDNDDDSEEDQSSTTQSAEKIIPFEDPVTQVEPDMHENTDDTLDTPSQVYTTGEVYIPGQEYAPDQTYTPGEKYTPGEQYTTEQQNTDEPQEDEHGIVVGELPEPYAVQETEENFLDINNKNKVPEIIVTNTKKNRKHGNGPQVTLGRINIADNEISKTDDDKLNIVLLKPEHKGLDFKSMNLTMKKALLRRAKAKKETVKNKALKRGRRDTTRVLPASSSTPTQGDTKRRHANSILVLKRSLESGCPCPPPGTPKGDQVLEVGAGCFNSVNDLLHFFVHVLGLDHQHNMHDRDNYLHIVWDKLTPDVRQEMEIKLPPAASAGFPYDYQSVMHYPWLHIKDGKTNIMYPIWNDGWAMGHWQGLSSVDVQKLNLLYFSQCMERQKQEAQ